MTSQNKNVRQLVQHLQSVDIAVEGSDFYGYNIEGDKNSVVSQASCRIAVTRLEYGMSKFTPGEDGGIRRFTHRWQWTVDALRDYFEGL